MVLRVKAISCIRSFLVILMLLLLGHYKHTISAIPAYATATFNVIRAIYAVPATIRISPAPMGWVAICQINGAIIAN
jgi:hypothetical protein